VVGQFAPETVLVDAVPQPAREDSGQVALDDIHPITGHQHQPVGGAPSLYLS
jgi:hypothetical protein